MHDSPPCIIVDMTQTDIHKLQQDILTALSTYPFLFSEDGKAVFANNYNSNSNG
jgi:hypothetical protein